MTTIFDKMFILFLKKLNKLLNNLYTKNREYVIVKLVGGIMEKNITLEEIKSFGEAYHKEEKNQQIENIIARNGLENSCMNKDVIMENPPVFNVELPETTIQNQRDSHKCWIYAGLNMILYDVANNLNMDVTKLSLSNNYIAFFDKLEKSNNAYENIIQLETISLDFINQKNIVTNCVAEGGYWNWFVAIVNKYGMVPKSKMPDVKESMNFQKLEEIFTEKVKKDITQILKLKESQESLENLREFKKQCLRENYFLLSKVLGEPKRNFDFEYKDKQNHYVRYVDITPLEFKEKFLKLPLDDFISIGNVPMYNKEYNRKYRKAYLGNIFEGSYVEFINLPIEELKRMTIEQLQDGVPVWLGTHIQKCRDTESGVLDCRLYDYDKMLDFHSLSKEESLNLRDIDMQHAMVFKGVNIIDNKPNRWKVEDSYGDKEKVNGYYIMNDNFFEKFVLNVIINKKYLTEEQRKIWKEEPILFEIGEGF